MMAAMMAVMMAVMMAEVAEMVEIVAAVAAAESPCTSVWAVSPHLWLPWLGQMKSRNSCVVVVLRVAVPCMASVLEERATKTTVVVAVAVAAVATA